MSVEILKAQLPQEALSQIKIKKIVYIYRYIYIYIYIYIYMYIFAHIELTVFKLHSNCETATPSFSRQAAQKFIHI